MVITMAIACVTTSVAVSIATTKILAAYYFKIVDSYVDEMCKEVMKTSICGTSKEEQREHGIFIL